MSTTSRHGSPMHAPAAAYLAAITAELDRRVSHPAQFSQRDGDRTAIEAGLQAIAPPASANGRPTPGSAKEPAN